MTLLLSLALAQSPEEGMTIVVEARQSVLEARAALDHEIQEQGYMPGVSLAGRTLYLHPQPWKPRVTVYDEGFLRVKARAVTPMVVLGTTMGGVFSSPRVARAYESRLLDALHPELTDWREALAELGLALRREELLGELAALEALPAPLARAHATRMWLDTADTPEGAEVRFLIEEWAEDALGEDFLLTLDGLRP